MEGPQAADKQGQAQPAPKAAPPQGDGTLPGNLDGNSFFAGLIAGIVVTCLVVLLSRQSETPQGLPSGFAPAAPSAGALPHNHPPLGNPSRVADAEARAQASPDDPQASVNLGNAYFDAGRNEDAAKAYGQALAKLPEDANVRTDRAVALFRLGRSDEAVAELEEAIQRKPDHATAKFNLAIVHYKGRGDRAKALEVLRRFVQDHPDFDRLDAARSLITEIESQGPVLPGPDKAGPPVPPKTP